MKLAVEKEKQRLEAKKKVEDEWKKKMVVDKPYFYTSTSVSKDSQLDRIKVKEYSIWGLNCNRE